MLKQNDVASTSCIFHRYYNDQSMSDDCLFSQDMIAHSAIISIQVIINDIKVRIDHHDDMIYETAPTYYYASTDRNYSAVETLLETIIILSSSTQHFSSSVRVSYNDSITICIKIMNNLSEQFNIIDYIMGYISDHHIAAHHAFQIKIQLWFAMILRSWTILSYYYHMSLA